MPKKKPEIPIERTYVGPEAEARLLELGLSLEIVSESVIYGQMQRDGCSSLDPPTFAGTTAWAATIRAFRAKVTTDLKWTTSNTANFCTAISPDGEWAVAISTGNSGTGVEGRESNFKHGRGTRTRQAVERTQISLFDLMFNEIPSVVLSKTWILLIARNRDYVFCEMKLPRLLDSDGRVEAWAERIIIPTIKLGDTPKESVKPDSGNEIVIDVTRRASK